MNVELVRPIPESAGHVDPETGDLWVSTCDWGSCNRPSQYQRWSPEHGWLNVCWPCAMCGPSGGNLGDWPHLFAPLHVREIEEAA